MTSYPPSEGSNPPLPPSGYPPPSAAHPQGPAVQPAPPQPDRFGQPSPYGRPQFGRPSQFGQPDQPGLQPGLRPPPPPGTVATEPAPPVAWLIPLAALLAVIGAFTPWFTPEASASGRTADAQNSLYSWKDGKIGLIAPIVLVVIAISVVSLLRGKRAGRLTAAADPVKAAGKYAAIAGGVSAVCLVIAWFLVTSQYTFNGLSWNELQKRLSAVHGTLSRGPQVGYFLTIAAAALAIIGGVLMMTMSGKPAPAAGTTPPPPHGTTPPPPPSHGSFPSFEKSPPPQA